MMQSQSSRGNGSLAVNSLPSRSRDAAPGHPATSRIGKFGGVESILDDMSSVVPSGELDVGQDDEMVPWLNYPLGNGLPQDYVSDLLPEMSGIAGSGMSAQNSFVSVDKRTGCDGTVINLHSSGSASKASSNACPVGSWPVLHRQTSNALGNGVSNVTDISNMNTHSGAMLGNTMQGKDMVNHSNVFNFPYVSRPATIVKTNNPKADGIPALSSSGVARMEVTKEGWAASSSNPFKSTLVDRSSSDQKDIGFHDVSSSKTTITDSGRPVFEAPKESFSQESIENLSKEPPIKNDHPVIPSNVGNQKKGAVDGDRNVEPMVVSSSVGSGNSADRISCDQTHNSKRKFHDVEESECHSDDIETDSIGVKKSTPARGGNGSKRGRAVEVHNLSERRRRDRINEKMRALQELIPNCNKVDKASMLDEAIEYLKTLQLQVQIMSMGAGLCMPPPMMFPAGIQHMHPQFSPMGVGMGMGMGLGFRMGMADASGRPPNCPIFPVPPMHFPSPMPGPVNFARIPAPNIPVYEHPSLGFHPPVPRAPVVPVTGQPLETSAMGLCGLRNGHHKELPCSCPSLNSVDPMTAKSLDLKSNAEVSSSAHCKCHEIQATNEVLGQSATVQDKQATNTTVPSSVTSYHKICC